jgi:hypothetical protein
MKKFFVAGATALAAIVLIALAAFGAFGKTSLSAKSAPAANANAITVHGRWTIEVKSPAGKRVSIRRFENALQLPYGSAVLAKFLARANSPGAWSIVLDGSDPPCSQDGTPTGLSVFCLISESFDTDTRPWIFKTVTVDAPTSGANVNALVVRAAIDATRDGSVTSVRTLVDQCDWNAPSPCSGTQNNQAFTFKTLDSPGVSVKDGQQILTTVVISFS